MRDAEEATRLDKVRALVIPFDASDSGDDANGDDSKEKSKLEEKRKGGTVRPAFDHSTSTVTTMKDGLFSVAPSLATGVRSRNRDIGFHRKQSLFMGGLPHHQTGASSPPRVLATTSPTSNPLLEDISQ